MILIKMLETVGTFASNKDMAREIRTNIILPNLEKGEEIIFDFEGVDGATQSFIHALISEAIRKFGSGVLNRMSFKSCNEKVQAMINIVTDYMQAGAMDY